MRSPWLVLLVPLASCQLAEGGGVTVIVDAGGSDAGFDAAPRDASVDSAAADAEGDAPAELDAGVDAPVGADAGVLTITGGAYVLRGPDAGICSTGAGPASFHIVNKRDASVDLIWFNGGCIEVPEAVMGPSATGDWNTSVDHVWRVRNDADKKFLGEFVLKSAGPYSVTVN